MAARLDGRGSFHSLQYRVTAAMPRDQHGQRNGRDGEDNCQPGRHLGEDIDGSAGAKSSLGSLAAKCARQVCARAWLQQYDPDQNETNYDVKCGKEINH